jgi:hypothetical protein
MKCDSGLPPNWIRGPSHSPPQVAVVVVGVVVVGQTQTDNDVEKDL